MAKNEPRTNPHFMALKVNGYRNKYLALRQSNLSSLVSITKIQFNFRKHQSMQYNYLSSQPNQSVNASRNLQQMSSLANVSKISMRQGEEPANSIFPNNKLQIICFLQSAQIQRLNQTIQNQQSKIQILNTENDKVKDGQLKPHELEIELLQNRRKYSQLEIKYNRSIEHLNSIDIQNQNLRAEISKLERTIYELRIQVQHLQSAKSIQLSQLKFQTQTSRHQQLNNKLSEIRRLKDSIIVLRKQKQQYETQNYKITQLQQQVQNLQSVNVQYENKIALLSQQIERLSRINKEKTDEIIKLRQQNMHYEQKTYELEHQIRQVRYILNQTQKNTEIEHANRIQQLLKQNQRRSANESQLTQQLQTQYHKHTLRQKQLQRQLQLLKSNFVKDVQIKQQQIMSQSQIQTQLSKRIFLLQTEKAQQKRQLEHLSTINHQLQHSLSLLTHQLQESKIIMNQNILELSRKQQLILQHQHRQQQLSHQKTTLSNQLLNLREKDLHSHSTTQQLQHQLQQLSSESQHSIHKLQQQINQYHITIQQHTINNETLSKQLEVKTHEIRASKDKQVSMHNQLKHLQELLGMANKQIQQLTHSINSKESLIKQLKNDLLHIQQRTKHQQQQINGTKRTLQQQQSQLEQQLISKQSYIQQLMNRLEHSQHQNQQLHHRWSILLERLEKADQEHQLIIRNLQQILQEQPKIQSINQIKQLISQLRRETNQANNHLIHKTTQLETWLKGDERLEHKHDQIIRLKMEINDLLREKQLLLRKIAEVERNSGEMSNRIKAQHMRIIEQMEREQLSLRQTLNKKNKQIDSKKKSTVQTQTLINQYEEKLINMEGQLERNKIQAQQMRKQFQQTLQQKNQQIHELSSIAIINKHKQSKQLNQSTTTTPSSSNRHKLQEYENKITLISQEVQRLQSIINLRNNQISTHKQTIEQLRTEQQSQLPLINKIHDLEMIARESQHRVKKLQKDNLKIRSDYEAKLAKYYQIQTQLQSLSHKLHNYDDQTIHHYEKQILHLNTLISQHNNKHQQLMHIMQELKNENIQLKNNNYTLTLEMKKNQYTHTKMRALNGEIDRLSELNMDLEQQIKECRMYVGQDSTFQRKYKDCLGLMVIQSVEIQSLRSMLKKSQTSNETMRRERLSPYK